MTMSNTFVAYCPTITGGKVLRFRSTAFPPYDKNGTQVYLVTDTRGNSIGWHVSCDGYTANVYDGPMDDEPSKSGPVYKTGEWKRRDIYPELEFERFESKAKKLLSFFSKNEGKYVVCRLAGLGIVLVYKVDYLDDRLELEVSTDLIARRTVVIDVADIEKEVCFLGDECVVSVA